MTRKRFIKLVMAHHISKRNAEAAAQVARTAYRSYDNAYQNMCFFGRGYGFRVVLPIAKKYKPKKYKMYPNPNDEYRMPLRYAATPMSLGDKSLYLGEWGTNHE